MTPQLSATAPFDRKARRIDQFSCEEEALDRWLRAYAGQNQQRDAAGTFVTTEPDGKVAGYYTLVAAQVEHEQATSSVRQGLSRHFPIPVALIARLEPQRGTKVLAWAGAFYLMRFSASYAPPPPHGDPAHRRRQEPALEQMVRRRDPRR